jgi:phosphopantothenoylcysteine decarboxylase/phosphopantothenate--cysteine ligase
MPRPDGRPFLVIFAAERAADLESRAARKLAEKGADAVVANPIDEAGLGMETAANRAVLLTRLGLRRELPAQGKDALARELLLALAGEIVAAPGR